MIYEGLQHYFIVNFPQRAGGFANTLMRCSVLMMTSPGLNTRKNNKSSGPALVGIELKHREDYGALIARMNQKGFHYVEVNKDQDLFHLLI